MFYFHSMVRHLSGYKLPLQLQRPLPSQGLQKLEDKFHTNLLEKPSHQIRVGVLLVRNVLQNALHRLLPSLYPHRPEEAEGECKLAREAEHLHRGKSLDVDRHDD